MDRTKTRWNGWGWIDHDDPAASRPDVWSWLASELGMPALLATPARQLEELELPASRLTEEQRHELISIVGDENVRSDPFERAYHALGRSYYDLLRLRSGWIESVPDLVLFPRSGHAVQALLSYASRQRIAVVPYGGGTSVVGGVTAKGRDKQQATVTVDLTEMNHLIAVDRVALTARAQAGISGPTLERALQTHGLTLGHFPQSFEFSTLGGWIAHAGAGQGSNGYGRVDDWLVGIEMATPRGMLATKPMPPSSTGPDLTNLMIGSEGAFGVITEATIRVRKIPQARTYRAFLFRDFESGQAAIRNAVQEGLQVTMLRLSDPEETRFYRAFSTAGASQGVRSRLEARYLRSRGFDQHACALIAGFEGDHAEVTNAQRRFRHIASAERALSAGAGPGSRWLQARFHGPYLRDPLMDRGVGVDTLETATSWHNLGLLYTSVRSALVDAIKSTLPRADAKPIVMCHISHSYTDGASLYFTYIFPRALDHEIEQWRSIKRAATDAIITNGGALSHHHGVGEDHLPWMAREKGALGVDILWAIKVALDPNEILNPGKLIPPLNGRG